MKILAPLLLLLVSPFASADVVSTLAVNETLTVNITDDTNPEVCGHMNVGYASDSSSGAVEPFCWAVTEEKITGVTEPQRQVWIRIISTGKIFMWEMQKFTPDFSHLLSPYEEGLETEYPPAEQSDA